MDRGQNKYKGQQNHTNNEVRIEIGKIEILV